MKAIEAIATINEQGQLSLDYLLELPHNRRVKVIVLISEDGDIDPDDTPADVVIASLQEGIHQAITGQTIPLSQLWDGMNGDYTTERHQWLDAVTLDAIFEDQK